MKRLDINDPQVWNNWRVLYSELTDQEQKDFLNDSEERYPVQQHHTKSTLLALLAPRQRILEIGGWKGELANYCLSMVDIECWDNIELCSNAVMKTVEMDVLDREKYFVITPDEFAWFKRPQKIRFSSLYDLCISAHTIEHFSNEHAKQLIACISGIKVVVFEAPISESGDNWHDYGGTHMLTMGWRGINEEMAKHGYSEIRLNENCYVYKL